MDRKKDIGELIKEYLGNTEVEPNSALWNNIEKTLDNKRRKRGGIIWWSAAILLIIGIFTGVFFLYDSNYHATNTNNSEHTIVESESKSKNKNSPNSLDEIKKQSKNTSIENNEGIENQKQSSVIKTTNSENANIKEVSKTTTQFSNHSNSVSRSNGTFKTTNKTTNQSEHKNQKENYQNEETKATNFDSTNKLVTENKFLRSTDIEKSSAEKLPEIKDSISEIAESKRKLVKETSIDIKKKKKADGANQTWSISIQGGPNTFEHSIDNNPFKSSLNNGVLKSKYSYSYGAFLNIPFNDKLIFRFGFRNSNYKFYIEEALSSVTNTGVLSILTNASIKRNGSIITSDFKTNLTPPNEFRIDQEISYQEVPFQFLYRITDKTVKIDAILGLSGMLMSKNNISLSTPNKSIEIGSGEYVNKVAFSSSVGLGFRYRLSDRLVFDLEPTFQFQHGAFKKEVKNLRPIILNLNIGTTIKL